MRSEHTGEARDGPARSERPGNGPQNGPENDPDDDLSGFAAFYRESVPRLVAFLICQGASPAVAAQCVQETAAAAVPEWATLNRPYVWCRTTAYRKLAARTTRGEPAGPARTGRPLATERLGELVEPHRSFLRWLDELPDQRQRVVLVCLLDGATGAEIVELLGLEPAVVQAALRGAREHLLGGWAR